MPKRPCSQSGPKPKAPKYMTKFNKEWKTDFKWLDVSRKGSEYGYCVQCKTDFKVCYGGKNDLKKHQDTVCHQKVVNSIRGTHSVKGMFEGCKVDSVACAEILFANFVAEHNLPFLVADHMSDLVKVMFPDSEIAKKFACKRTKTTHIINQALGPHFDNKATDLCRSNKFSVMIDESNDQGDQKLLTILVRVYDQDVKKISTKFLGIPRCNIGTADSIFSTLNQVFIDRDIPWKNCVGFSSDNCNVMVGKNNSVLSRVKEANPNVFDMGCVCHLANICVQKAVKTLALPVDDLLTEVFYHFRRSTKRQEAYKEFLEFTNTDALKIIRHCQTRWLSLEKCVSRFLHQWSALKSYFTSHEDVEKSGRVKRVSDWLNDPLMWLYYGFLEFVLPFMNEFNVMFQGGESMIGYLHTEMTRLLRKLMGRFTTTEVIRDATDLPKVPFQVRENQHDDERLAVGWRVREYLDNSDVSTEITKKFFSDVRVFYEKMVATMVAKFPFKDATLQSLSFLKPDLRDTIKALKFILSCRIF